MKNYFHRMTLYVLPEVHQAMQCVVVECIHVSEDMNLFTINYGKSIPLLEFESQQNLGTDVIMKYLKESWLERIAQCVRMCLRDLENGWLDLEQKNREMYDVAKLKRFTDVAVLRMQVKVSREIELHLLRNMHANIVILLYDNEKFFPLFYRRPCEISCTNRWLYM